ncbi:FadR family transcriptional regulator [Ruania suaedae]|uniref:FadR/GntR family transcriptional regulator n=1 Tax=Ruania suaedae TaxID=2897774 RepID=UPI001E2E56F3|nr:FadR/GntR family transcriptional regulator [Ruania suaedae]UFU02976.1 FadR family transcriptional regulator [Ruania suaedae]
MPTPFDDVVSRLEAIVLAHPAGERLPAEKQLADDLGVSRLTVREALRALGARGLVEVSQGRRAVVRDPTSAVLAGYFSVSVRREPRGLAELLEIRRSLEGLSAADAARHATQPGLVELDEAIARMAGAARALDSAREGPSPESVQAYVTADVSFHGTLAHVSGNRLLSQLLEGLSDALGHAFTESIRGHVARGGTHHDVVEQHRGVVEAVRRGDPVGAATAMERHLAETAEDLRAAVDG